MRHVSEGVEGKRRRGEEEKRRRGEEGKRRRGEEEKRGRGEEGKSGAFILPPLHSSTPPLTCCREPGRLQRASIL
jgi:hypothetical protein